MAKWECIVCGLIYDEAEGWPDDGIAAGTLWKDVPEDWLCPDCGVGKEDFELIEGDTEEDSSSASDEAHTVANNSVVIIGTGLAGYGLAKEFRKLDENTELILITSDDGASYSKPMLSTGYTKDTSAEDLAQLDADGMAAQLGASVLKNANVVGIDLDRMVVQLEDREEISYGKLVLAIGSETITPSIEGDALERVFSVNDLLDYADYRSAISEHNVKKVCIIGAGLIGCEFANDLLNGGFEVDIVDPMPQCLPALLPEPAARALEKALTSHGAKFYFGPHVKSVNHIDDGLSIKLSDGNTLRADLVVSAVGVRPRTNLAKTAGIDVDRGIKTNQQLETSKSNVFALGDCAEVCGHVLVYVAPLMAAAKALARTLSGQSTAVKYPAMPVTIKTPICPVVVSPPQKNSEGAWSIVEQGLNVRAEYRNSSGDLLGFALTGDATKARMELQKLLPPILL